MLSDIKQINKTGFQKLKIHNTIFFRNCTMEISKNIGSITDELLVFICYKLSTIDHTSFGFSMDTIWDNAEERLLNKMDTLPLLIQKSLLYSLGKSARVTKVSLKMYKKMLDKNDLMKKRNDKHFMEYLGNLLLSGGGRGVYEHKEFSEIIPFIQELMEDEQIDKQQKITLIGSLSALVYRIGVYDKRFWDYFFKYESYYINDRAMFFNLIYITKTMPAISDEVPDKDLVAKCADLYAQVQQLPYYEQEIQKISGLATQSRQSLFEQRFDFFANAYGVPFVREKMIDEIFSIDMFIERHQIAIEIEGHNHYNQQPDGSFKRNVITNFKHKYLTKKGIKVIHLGRPEQLLPNNHRQSILRVFLQQYNQILNEQKQQNELTLSTATTSSQE